MKNIYVSNLSFRINDEDLKQTFAEYGEVISAKVIADNYSGKSRGFGFVEMDSPEAAASAITMFHGKDFQGRDLSVSEARPRNESGAPRSGGYNRNDGGGNSGNR